MAVILDFDRNLLSLMFFMHFINQITVLLDSLCLKTYKKTPHLCFYVNYSQRYHNLQIFLSRCRPSWIFEIYGLLGKNPAWHSILILLVCPRQHLCEIWCFYHQTRNHSQFCLNKKRREGEQGVGHLLHIYCTVIVLLPEMCWIGKIGLVFFKQQSEYTMCLIE